jgi:hypothetical protein
VPALPIRIRPGAADLTVLVSFKTPAATTSMLLASGQVDGVSVTEAR